MVHTTSSIVRQHAAICARDIAVVLDVDNTLTPPRKPLEPSMAALLRRLTAPFFLGAGGDLRLISEQFIEPLHDAGYRGSFDAFLCNGSTRYRVEIAETPSVQLLREFVLRDHIGSERFDRLRCVIEETLEQPEFQLPAPMQIIGERIVDRVSMINVAPIGRPRERLSDDAQNNREHFRAFDAATRFRERFLRRLNDRLADFTGAGLCVTLGGETSFDIVATGNDKSYPLRSLLDEGFRQVYFLGDALFQGGNDGAVLDFINAWNGSEPCPVTAIRVESWLATPKALETLGLVGPTFI